jgi:hypothetical protein
LIKNLNSGYFLFKSIDHPHSHHYHHFTCFLKKSSCFYSERQTTGSPSPIVIIYSLVLPRKPYLLFLFERLSSHTHTFSVVGPSFFYFPFSLSFLFILLTFILPPHSMQLTNKGHEPSNQQQQQDSKHRSSIKQSTVAESLLSDTLFPPRKPKPAPMIYDDTFDSDNEQSEDSDKDPVKKDPLATQVWRMYTKAKDNLPNGSRLENLTWRMMAMTLKKKEREAAAAASSTVSSPQSDVIDDRIRHTSQPPTTFKSRTDDYYHPMALDHDVVAKKDKNTMQQSEALMHSQYRGATGTDPPESDDTTALLSSSAPPYMFDFLNSNPALTNRTATQPDSGASNTLVSGSTRALLPGKSTGAMSNRGGLHQHTVSFLSHPE